MAAAHYVFYSTETGEAKYCAVGKKAERSMADIAKAGLKYTGRERSKDDCPFCNPAKAPADDPEQALEAPAKLDDEKPEPIRPGQCWGCRGSRAGIFKLAYENRHMIRSCQDCGHKLNVETMEVVTK